MDLKRGASRPGARGANRRFWILFQPDGTIRNISIPVSAFDNGSGNGFYTLQQLDLPQGSQLVLSMSDANGIFSGGTSAVMRVGASQTQQACNTTDPGRVLYRIIFATEYRVVYFHAGTNFYFSLDSPLAQCRQVWGSLRCDLIIADVFLALILSHSTKGPFYR